MTWDYNQTEYQKQAKADPKWHLERLINYNLNGEKLEAGLFRVAVMEQGILKDWQKKLFSAEARKLSSVILG